MNIYKGQRQITCDTIVHRGLMIFSNVGCLKIYRFLVNLLPSVHLHWFMSWDGHAGLIFLHYMQTKCLSYFSAFSLQLGPVPSGVLKYNTITIYYNLSLSLSVSSIIVCLPSLLAVPPFLVSLKFSSSVLNHIQAKRTKKTFDRRFCPVALQWP